MSFPPGKLTQVGQKEQRNHTKLFPLKIALFACCPIQSYEGLRTVTLILVESLLGVAVRLGTVLRVYDRLLHQVALQKHEHPSCPREPRGLSPLILPPPPWCFLIWL